MSHAQMAARAHIPVELKRAQSTLEDSPRSTAQTAQIMCGHIRQTAASPIVRSTARRIATASGASDELALARAVWLYIKQLVRFVQDDILIRRLFNEGDQLELLIAPDVLLSMDHPEGDCDDFTMLTCALLQALGIRSQIVCLCCDVNEPARFSHVYPRALVNGKWMALDSSHGSFPGWKVPARDTFREQHYDLNGACVADVVTPHPPARRLRTLPRDRTGLAGVGMGAVVNGVTICTSPPAVPAGSPLGTTYTPTGVDQNNCPVWGLTVNPGWKYVQEANLISSGVSVALGLVLPGWWKLLALLIPITGIPGPTMPDGTPMFRPMFYGGL